MTAPRTWDVTLRVTDTCPAEGELPKNWNSWARAVRNEWDEVRFVSFLSATEVKTWCFGDVVTEDNKPDVPFNIVDAKGVMMNEHYDLSKDRGVWRLIWIDGQELA